MPHWLGTFYPVGIPQQPKPSTNILLMTNVLPLTRSWFLLLRKRPSSFLFLSRTSILRNSLVVILRPIFTFSPSDILSSQHCILQLCVHHPPWHLIDAPQHGNFLLLDHFSKVIEPSTPLEYPRASLSHLKCCSSNLVAWQLARSLWILHLSRIFMSPIWSHFRILNVALQILLHDIFVKAFEFSASFSTISIKVLLSPEPQYNPVRHLRWIL